MDQDILDIQYIKLTIDHLTMIITEWICSKIKEFNFIDMLLRDMLRRPGVGTVQPERESGLIPSIPCQIQMFLERYRFSKENTRNTTKKV